MLECTEYWENDIDSLENLQLKRDAIEFEIENIIYTEKLEGLY